LRSIAYKIIGLSNAPGLGPTIPELALGTLGSLHLGTFSKSLFSMVTPEVTQAIASRKPPVKSVILCGIEVCLEFDCV
jgi:hypothetical protein